ncbi:hypothetical protein [Cronobacter sakazakii]|uniref:hypothetical protein n=1 Tax=Cronobacter sakazakii TaxID=28141 RepID=UPI00294AF5A0|nr:hypothetical protein [Cronobacter sakazakii]
MKLNLDLVINSGDADVDMDYAIETLLGASGVTRTVTEAILTGNVQEKSHPKNETKTKLKHSFTGSYGQCFDVVISNKDSQVRLKEITKPVFIEIMSYYINEALFLDVPPLSTRAKNIISSLDEIENSLTRAIRNKLIKMHKISLMSNYPVDLNLRQKDGKQKIITINKSTALNLTVLTESKKEHYISAVITRFNTLTKNGRLLVSGERKTTSFGFVNGAKYVTESQTKAISENLSDNDNVSEENRVPLTLKVRDMIISNGETVKYLVVEVLDL